MQRRGLLASIALVFCTLFVTVHHTWAQDEPFPIELRVGETFEVCTSGQIVCPAMGPICDDLKIAVPVGLPGDLGLGFKGVGSGTTLCSAASSAGLRRVFRIIVR
jgi:hypothetical protein